MKKDKLWLAALIAVFMTLILLVGFVGRISYEQHSRYAFVSADMTNLKQNGQNTEEALAHLRDAGAQIVTVEPLTIKGLQEAGRIELISYSSLSISQDPISQQVAAVLSDYPMEPDNLIAIVTDPALSGFMSMELSFRYTDYTNRFLEDAQTVVFAFQNLTQDNDLIVGYDYQELNFIRECGMQAAIVYPSYTFENPLYPKYFTEFFNSNDVSFLILRNNPYDNQKPLSEEMKAVLRTLDFTLVVWENENQISNEKPYLYDTFFHIMKYRTVRGFHMDKILSYDQSLYRYRYYQWFNSAIERNTVFIHTNLLANPDVDPKTNFDLTLRAISDFTAGMRGYQFPKSRENLPYPYPTDTMVMAGGILALTLIYLYLLFCLKKTPAFFTEGYFGAMIASVIASYAFSSYLGALYALIILVFGVATLTAILFYLDKHFSGKKTWLWMLLSVAGMLFCGIVSIAALLGGIEFYTSTKLFYGVKISLLLPLLLTVFNAYQIYYSDTLPLKELPKAVFHRIKAMNRWILILVSAAVVLILAYYLLRSGKSDLILTAEDRFRKWLTDVFYIRPRLKEFLFAFPSLVLFFYCSLTGAGQKWKLLFGVCQTVFFTSVLNTFCHTFTAVSVSLWRVANGILCGIVVSAVVIGIVIGIQKVLLPYIRKKTA